MPHAIWKGAISFGLVHVPVAVYPASRESDIDFDWLDKRSMDPVGYKRINKRTGKEVPRDQVVRGVKVGSGDYVLLSDDEIRAAYPKSTQSIEIESFVAPTQLPFTLLERPYLLEPLARGEKVYALLREAMRDAGLVGVARVVLRTKEHLAVLVPVGPALLLNTLRWARELLSWEDFRLPPDGSKAAQLKPAELKMAARLVADMRQDWHAERYADRFTQGLKALIEQRAAAGRTEAVQPMEEPPTVADNVVDLTELLRRSLGQRKPMARKAAKPRRAAARRRA
jgi:DNA end-binding protein Ku